MDVAAQTDAPEPGALKASPETSPETDPQTGPETVSETALAAAPAGMDTLAGPAGVARSTPLTVAVRHAIRSVRAETRALRANPTSDLKAFEYGKSQALLDLTRARSVVPTSAYSDELREELDVLKAELQENVGLLKMHMNAVSEVVQMMSRTMIDFDSDGTYQAPFPERAR